MSDDWIGRAFLMFWWICSPHLPFQSELSTPCTHISCPPCPAEKRRNRLSKFNPWKMLRLLSVWRMSACPDLSFWMDSFCCPRHQWEHRDCPVHAAVQSLCSPCLGGHWHFPFHWSLHLPQIPTASAQRHRDLFDSLLLIAEPPLLSFRHL